MSADLAVRQWPGFFANLVRVECDDCGWIGPMRSLDEYDDRRAIDTDKARHYDECGGAR